MFRHDLEDEASLMKYRTVTVDIRFTYTIDEGIAEEAYSSGLSELTVADIAERDSTQSILEFVDEVKIVDGSWKLSPICEPERTGSGGGDCKILPFPSKY